MTPILLHTEANQIVTCVANRIY